MTKFILTREFAAVHTYFGSGGVSLSFFFLRDNFAQRPPSGMQGMLHFEWPVTVDWHLHKYAIASNEIDWSVRTFGHTCNFIRFPEIAFST